MTTRTFLETTCLRLLHMLYDIYPLHIDTIIITYRADTRTRMLTFTLCSGFLRPRLDYTAEAERGCVLLASSSCTYSLLLCNAHLIAVYDSYHTLHVLTPSDLGLTLFMLPSNLSGLTSVLLSFDFVCMRVTRFAAAASSSGRYFTFI